MIPRKLRGKNAADVKEHKGTILKFLSNPLIGTGLDQPTNGGGMKRQNDDCGSAMDEKQRSNKKSKMECFRSKNARDSKSHSKKRRGGDLEVKKEINQSMDLRSFFGSGVRNSQGISKK